MIPTVSFGRGTTATVALQALLALEGWILWISRFSETTATCCKDYSLLGDPL